MLTFFYEKKERTHAISSETTASAGNTLIICPPPPPTNKGAAPLLHPFASMSTPRPRIRAIPLRPLLLILLVPLIYSGKNLSLLFPASTLQWMAPLTLQYVPVSRLHPSAPEKGVCLPPPAGPKRPNHLVLGPSAGQGRPDRLQCRGSPSFASGSSMCPV
jgi:hypothetical protein